MMFLVIFVISVGGILGEEDDSNSGNVYDDCAKLVGGERLLVTEVIEKEELLEKCPTEIEYIGCLVEKMEAKNFDEDYISVRRKFYNFTKDLCDEDSEMHKNYIASVPCFKTMEGDAKTCNNYGKNVYRTYFQLLNHVEPEDVDADWVEIQAFCMVMSVTVACLSEKVLEECGAAAYTTMTDIINESGYLSQVCNYVKDILQTSLLSNLDLDEDTKDLYGNIFNNIKK